LVQEHRDDFGSEYEAIKAIAGRLGMNPETLRKWLGQAEVEAGQVDGTTTAAAREIRELKRKNAELEQTVAILKAATSFNACGESARNTDHLYSRRRASCSGRGRDDLPRAESAWLPDRPENLLCMGPPGAVATRPVGHRHHRDLGRLLRARRASACATQRVLLPALLRALNLARHDAI